MNSSLRFFSIILIATGSAFGEEQPPPAPIITAPAAQMEWTMTLESGPNVKNAVPLRPWDASVWTYIHSGDLTKVVVTYKSGTREYWRSAGITLCQNLTLHKIDVRPDDPRYPVFPCASDGFYGLGRVKPEDDQGVKEFEGANYHYFRGSNDAQLSANSAPTYEAWFDLKTGLPKALRENNLTYLYTFSDSVPGELEFPTEWKTALDQFRVNLQRSGLSTKFPTPS